MSHKPAHNTTSNAPVWMISKRLQSWYSSRIIAVAQGHGSGRHNILVAVMEGLEEQKDRLLKKCAILDADLPQEIYPYLALECVRTVKQALSDLKLAQRATILKD